MEENASQKSGLNDASLTFLVSLLGPSLCSPEAPAAEDDDPEAAVAAAAEPEADITLTLLCLVSLLCSG